MRLITHHKGPQWKSAYEFYGHGSRHTNIYNEIFGNSTESVR